jgi:threonine dehydratase
MIPSLWLEQAAGRIAPHIRKTPLTVDPERDLYLKWENHQVTGSFKIRGALNKILSLQPWERERGLVAASAGNHGQGVALAGRLVGAKVIVFASDHAVPAKVEDALGVMVRGVMGAEQAGQVRPLEWAAWSRLITMARRSPARAPWAWKLEAAGRPSRRPGWSRLAGGLISA